MKKQRLKSLIIFSLILAVSLAFVGCLGVNVNTGSIPAIKTFTLDSDGYPDTSTFMINDKIYSFWDNHKANGKTSVDIKLADINNNLVVLLPEITNGMEWRVSENIISEKSVIEFNVSANNTRAGSSKKIQKFVISQVPKPEKINFSEFTVNGELAYQLTVNISN